MSAALDRYSQAVAAVKDHIEQNKPVFDAHQRLVLRVVDAENDLRDELATSMQSEENSTHKATVTAQSQTFGDIEAIDKLIADGVIPANVRDQIVKTQPRPPRISIGETPRMHEQGA